MAEIEVKATENVIKACSRTPSVRNCVLTSSLLACVWRDGISHDLSPVINHESWSDESLCIDKKVHSFQLILLYFPFVNLVEISNERTINHSKWSYWTSHIQDCKCKLETSSPLTNLFFWAHSIKV